MAASMPWEAMDGAAAGGGGWVIGVWWGRGVMGGRGGDWEVGGGWLSPVGLAHAACDFHCSQATGTLGLDSQAWDWTLGWYHQHTFHGVSRRFSQHLVFGLGRRCLGPRCPF